MDYYAFNIEIENSFREILIAFLGSLPFDSFVETEKGFTAYLPSTAFNENIIEELEQLKVQFAFEYNYEKVKPKNWNSIWESNFKPIQVNNFCGIRAEFHPPFKDVVHELVISPKMAFGTGHHETTFMMIQRMQDIDFQQAMVFDFGCGTGILAILAAKMGAKAIDAIDIEKAAYENSLENVILNKVGGINVYEGTLKDISASNYQIILANINRNVILDTLPTLYKKLSSGGKLLVSGILISDKAQVLDLAKKQGFIISQQLEKGEWCCLTLQK